MACSGKKPCACAVDEMTNISNAANRTVALPVTWEGCCGEIEWQAQVTLDAAKLRLRCLSSELLV